MFENDDDDVVTQIQVLHRRQILFWIDQVVAYQTEACCSKVPLVKKKRGIK